MPLMRTISRHGTNLTKYKETLLLLLLLLLLLFRFTCACNIKMNYILRKNRNESTVLLFNAYSERGTHLCTCNTP